MAEQNNQAQAATQEQGKDVNDQAATQGQETKQAGAVSPTPEELKKAIDALDNSTKEIQGLNRKISEMEKAAKQKEIESLKGTEREKAEAELLRQEKEKLIKENQEIVKSRIKDRELHNAGIPVDFAKRIIGDSEDEIVSDVKGFKDYIDKLVNAKAEAEINKRLGGKAPILTSGPISEGTITRQEFNTKSNEEKLKLVNNKTKIID
jgi:hypothetical protein